MPLPSRSQVVVRGVLRAVVRVALRDTASLARGVAFTGVAGGSGGGRSVTSSARVTVRQAAILQGFRPDYPWQGSRYQQFWQIGNAVPLALGRRVVIESMRRQA